MKEHEEILRQRIFLQRLPNGIDKIIDQTISPLEVLISNPMIDKDQRASLASACSKLITQYKFDLLSLDLQVIQNIRRGHQHVLVKLLDKLVRCDWDEAMKEAIVVRQDAMVKRYELCLQHKLHSFFVEAPMV